MAISIRPAVAADAAVVGRISYDAFTGVADEHGVPRAFPSVDDAIAAAEAFVGQPDIFSVVAERDGAIVGVNFLREYNTIAGVGPLSVEPALQNSGIGRVLMQTVLERSVERSFPGIRLVASMHNRSALALYIGLAFQARESLAWLQGPSLGTATPGHAVRVATHDDLAACDALCRRVHGHTRSGELARTVERGSARVVERSGSITGYVSAVASNGHGVAETNDDLKAMIAAAKESDGIGLLVPFRNGELLRWCLASGLRIVQTATLMSIGLYNEPTGAWFPSVIS